MTVSSYRTSRIGRQVLILQDLVEDQLISLASSRSPSDSNNDTNLINNLLLAPLLLSDDELLLAPVPTVEPLHHESL
jgi:hypothetical protein